MVKYSYLWLAIIVTLVWWIFLRDHGQAYSIGDPAPEISGGPWINSEPLTLGELRGRVVLVEFWTYG